MSEEHNSYLPVHSGMPTSPPSSQPVELTTVSAVEAFLSGTPFASQSTTALQGGTINYLYRIELLTPFEGNQTVVLKHAQPFWKTSQSNSWGVERMMFEVEAMTRIRSSLSSEILPVIVPKIHHFDAHNNLIIMEDCGADVITLREFLSSSSASSSMDLAEIIGAAIGKFIALVHEWSRSNPDGILDVLEKNLHAKKAIASLNYERLVPTLQRTDEDDLTLLSDFEVEPSHIQVISKLMDEYRSLLMSARVPGREVLLMGDLWHENILLDANEHSPRLFILDWELARTGLPGSEVGLFCSNMNLLGQRNYKLASAMLQNFIEAYSRISNREMRLAQDVLVHWGISHIFWAPRDPPGDRKMVQDFVKEGVELLVHFEDKDFLAESPIKGLLRP